MIELGCVYNMEIRTAEMHGARSYSTETITPDGTMHTHS